MRIVDVRSSENQLAIVGGALTLPTDNNFVSAPLPGSIRWNVGSEKIEIYFSGSWTAFTEVGSLSSLADVQLNSPADNQVLTYNSGSSKWTNKNSPYDIFGTFLGNPLSDQLMWRIVIPRSITLPVNLTGSVTKSQVAPAGDTSLILMKNGISIGNIDFAMGSIVATFTFVAPVNFVSGDILELDAPNPADPNLFSPSWALVANRT